MVELDHQGQRRVSRQKEETVLNCYGFKPNPKQQVTNKAKTLFGKDVKITVTGTRPTPLDCKKAGISVGAYLVECLIDDKIIATAFHRNWRTAYRVLVVGVEKAYENTLTS